jgi:thiamine kinase-like enzyme
MDRDIAFDDEMAEGVTPPVKNSLTTLNPLPFDTSVLAHVPVFTGRDLSRLRAEPLGSITNRTYRLTLDEDSYVARIAGPTTRYLDRETEAHNARIAHDLGLAPPVLFIDEQVLLTRYVDGARPLTAVDLAEPRRLAQVAAMLRRLQSSRVPFRHERHPFGEVDRYIGTFSHGRAVSLRSRLQPVERALSASPMPLVPAHVDASASNFILCPDDSLLLVDWEFSSMADRAWDVASILMQRPDDADARRFVAEAAGEDSTRMLARVALFRIALCLVAGSWCAMEAAARKDDALMQVAERYLDRCDQFRSHADLPRWLEAV